MRQQKRWDARGLFLLGAVGEETVVNPGPVPREEEDESQESMWCVDDVTGHELDPTAVRRARREEIECYRRMDAFEVVPVSRCWEATGRAPIGVRWLDIDK